jgi:hypothetical protein
MKDLLVAVAFLAMLVVPAFAALDVFSPRRNRF